ETIHRSAIALDECVNRLAEVGDALDAFAIGDDIAGSRAKQTELDTEATPAIPATLGVYLNDQLRATYTIEALLAGVVALAKEASQDDIEWSLEHIQSLIKQLGERLDSVNLSRAARGES